MVLIEDKSGIMKQLDSSWNYTPSHLWHIRPYCEGDIPAITDLANLVSKADGLDRHISENMLRLCFTSHGAAISRQVLVVDGPQLTGVPQGRLLGFCGAFPSENEASDERMYDAKILCHPACCPFGLEGCLVAQVLEIVRCLEAAPHLSPRGKVVLRARIRGGQTSVRAAFEKAGLREVEAGLLGPDTGLVRSKYMVLQAEVTDVMCKSQTIREY